MPKGSPSAETDPLIGRVINDRFKIIALIAHGGMGRVYRAEQAALGRVCAVKVLRPNTSDEQASAFHRRFFREASISSKLTHANTVTIFDYGRTEEGMYFMAMEYLEGRTLQHVLRHEGTFREARCAHVARQICRSVREAHSLGVIHRDLKPANVHLMQQGDEADFVKVLDFGLVKNIDDSAGEGLTQDGLFLGSPKYMAPEQIRSEPVDARTDIYSLGIVMYEMMTGKVPFDRPSAVDIVVAHMQERVPPMRHLFPLVEVSDAFERVVMKCIEKRPEDRFKSIDELLLALRRAQPSGEAIDPSSVSGPMSAAVSMKPSPMSSDSISIPRGTPSRHLLWLPVSAVLALLFAAGALYGFTRNSKPAEGTGAKALSTQLASVSSSPASTPAAAAPKCGAGMVEIPGGKFFMGADDGQDDEKPAHNVTLRPYCMDRTEVTLEDYKACSDSGECKRAAPTVSWPDMSPHDTKIYSPLCNVNDAVAKAKHPVNCVDWDMARTFCAARSRRLPTEAEWEFAARGPDGRIYPWGDAPPDGRHINACGAECTAWAAKIGESMKPMYPEDDGFPNTAPVGSFPLGASRYGLLDVVGNVWEWTADWDGKYDDAPKKDPTGPESGTDRIVRGGAWNGAFAAWVRPTQRYSFPPATKSHAVGFRCASAQTD